jgi:hypothetical protein
VRGELPDAVAIACGSTAAPAPLAGSLGLDDFLREDGRGRGERVAVVDHGAAGLPLWTAALAAAQRGAREVTIVTPVPTVAGEVEGATFLALYGELSARGVRFATDCVAVSRDGPRLELANVYGGPAEPLEVDLVVASTPRVAAGAGLAEALADLRPTVLGDAAAPRDAAAAIQEGAAWAATQGCRLPFSRTTV